VRALGLLPSDVLGEARCHYTIAKLLFAQESVIKDEDEAAGRAVSD